MPFAGKPLEFDESGRASIESRFTAKVLVTDNCWIWTASKRRFGHGQFKADSRMVAASRVAYALWIGPVPGDRGVLHTCDNPKCVRPDHLFLGTHIENMADMRAKGRGNQVFVGCHGENHPKSKLTNDQVSQILCLLNEGRTQTAIAALFGVSRPTISHIKTGLRWSPGREA